MINFETTILVAETKGLLRELDSMVNYARRNVAFDNIHDLGKELDQMRKLIDVIEEKTKVTETEDEGDEWI